MVSLYNRHYYDRAAEQYYIAQSLPEVIYDEEFDLVMAGMRAEQKQFEEAESLYLKVVKKTKERNSKALWALTTFYLTEYSNSTYMEKKLKAKTLVLEYLEKIRIVDNTAMTCYRIAQTYLAVGDRGRAQQVLRESIKNLSDSDLVKKSMVRLLNAINKNDHKRQSGGI